MEFHSVELSYSITDPDNLSIAVLLKSTFKESIFARIIDTEIVTISFLLLPLLLLYWYTQMGISCMMVDHLPVRLEMAAFVTAFLFKSERKILICKLFPDSSWLSMAGIGSQTQL